MKCVVCQSGDVQRFIAEPRDREYFTTAAVDDVVIDLCKHCLSLFQDPQPTAEQCASYYPPDYQNYMSGRVPLLSSLLEKQQKKAAKAFLMAYGQDAVILDFGCGDGLFLRCLEGLGAKNLFGFEPNYRESNKSAPLRSMIVGKLDDLMTQGIQFDVIRMNHVIEHLADLDAEMLLLRRLLKPGGRIVGQTPNPAHFSVRLFGAFWGALHFPYHTVLLSPKGLREAAPRWHMQLVQLRGTIMPTVWSMSAENWLKKVLDSQRRGRLPIYSLLVFGGLCIAVVDRLINQNETGVYDFVLEAV
ncbi:MAG: class I SAM-dependent methyltransferase [Kiloniellaceae bacterium]